MSYQSGDFSDGGSTSIDDTQMPHQIKPASTTTKNTVDYLAVGSKLDKIVGNDNIEKVIEKKTEFKLGAAFKLNEENISKSNFDSSEESIDYNNLPNSEPQRQENSLAIVIPREVENRNEQNSQNNQNAPNNPENKESFLNKKKKRNKPKKKKSPKKYKIKKDNIIKEILRCCPKKKKSPKKYKIKKDNIIKEILRCCFNGNLKSKIEKKVKQYRVLFFNFFPKKFIIKVKNNKYFLNYTLEKILKEKSLSEDKENSKFTNNVLDFLKSINYADLKKTFRTLYEEFLTSDEFNSHLNDLIKNKKELKAKAFEEYSRKFLEE